MRFRFLSPFCLTILLWTHVASGANYFLSSDGRDDNPGMAQRPWRTLAKANAALRPGDTVILADGRYEGVVEPAFSGRDGAPITYRARSEHGAVVMGGRSSDDVSTCIRLKGREHIVVDGLKLLPNRGGWMQLDSASHCVIRNCHMEHASGVYTPIYCRDCHYNRYQNLSCSRSLHIRTDGHVYGDLWMNSDCSRNIFERVHISRAGHRPFGLWFDCDHNVVRQCLFDCRWGRNFECFSTPRLLMEACVITNGFEGSGSADGRAKLFVIDSIFRRNVIYRNYYGPLVINSYKYETNQPWAMKRSRLYHNTWYRNDEWSFTRQRNTTARLDASTAASGRHSIRVYAEKDAATMSCHIRPRWWDIDRFPIVRFAYRIPRGVPVGVCVHAFESSKVGRGAVCVGGSPACEPGPNPNLKQLSLKDDDQWHEAEFDSRLIRKLFPGVKLLQTFRFYTNANGKKGDTYWFDNFRIVPEGSS